MVDYGDGGYMRKDMPGGPAASAASAAGGVGLGGRTKTQNRATVQQLKLIGQSHPTGLTSNLLRLFEPRQPLEHKPPPEKRKCPPYTGIGEFVQYFANPTDPEYAPPVTKAELPAERRARIHALRLQKGAEKAAEELEKYDPQNDPTVQGDPYKTLFIARISYETTEHKIKREFEAYGPVKRVRLIHNKINGKPRGYGFIEYQHTRDMKMAYKQADGRKIDNRRVLVDVERGRTVPNWRPRRLGGGLGSTRVGGEDVNQKYSGREPQVVSAVPTSRVDEPKARSVERAHDSREPERRERDRDRDREYDRDRDRDRERDRGRDRERGGDHERHRGSGRDRDREREREHSNRDRDRDRERDRDRDRYQDRDRERERTRDRDREQGGVAAIAVERSLSRDRDRER